MMIGKRFEIANIEKRLEPDASVWTVGFVGGYSIKSGRFHGVPIAGIYFIRCGQFVKIGKSGHIRKRFKDLELANPQPIWLQGYVDEPDAARRHQLERELHILFMGDRHRGEWFRYSEHIDTYIRNAADRGDGQAA